MNPVLFEEFAYLPDLIGFHLTLVGLDINNFDYIVPSKYMVTAFDMLSKSQRPQQRTDGAEGDVVVGATLKYAGNEFATVHIFKT